MKLYLSLVLFLFLSVEVFSQSAKKGSNETNRRSGKVRKQMRHFGKPEKDKKLKTNGTSYWMYFRTHSKYKVDGDGYKSWHPKKKKNKKRGVN